MPNSAFAENNTKAWQYAAISTDANPDFGIYKREYHKENVQVNGKYKTYWVRNGYHIDVEQVHRYDSGDKTLVDGTPTLMPVYDDVIRVYRADDWEESNADGLLSSMKVSNSNMGITTLNGKDLQDVTAGTFVGASSGGGTEVPSNYNYLINDNGKWVDAGNEKFKDYFKTVTYDNTLGGYTYNNQLVDPQNVYFIDGQAGVFLVSRGVNGEKEVYKGAVYGAYNEILVTGKDSNGNYYSYWGAERTDPNETIGDKLTVGQYNNTISWLNDNIRDIHEDDIKQIQVKATDNGGTIGLQTNGKADSKGNPTGGKNIPGTITIKNPTIDSGTNGKDVKIQFGSIGEDGKTDVAKFTVDAGSKVEGLKDEATAKDGDTLTGLKINGVEYDLSQGKTYSPGQGIAISDDNKISVDKGDGLEFTSNADDAKLEVNANEDKGIIVNSSGVAVNAGEGLAFETEGTDKGKLKVNVGKGLSINDSNQIVNNLEVTKATQNPNDSNEEHSDGGNWTITDSKANVTLKNTTLVNETAERQEMQGINEEYGGTYSVKDTDGNTVTLSDVASATKLQSIDNTKIGDLQYSGVTGTEVTNNDSLTTAVGKLDNAVEEATTEAGKHASVSVGDNLSVDSSKTNTNGGIDYHVTLDDTLYLGGEHTAENSKITLDGETGTAIIGNSTNGKATIGGVNITTTTTGESTSSTVTGLTNTTLGDDAPNSTFAKVGRAATEEQLQKAMTKIDEASYKGWNVTTNKGTKTAEVASNGNVDFSNTDGNIIVGQTGTNLTFDLNDNITLGDESGTRIQLNGNPQKDSMISITNKDSDTVFNVAKDGTVHSDGDIVAKADSNKKYSLSEVGENAVRYNENKSTVALAGTNVADGDVSEGSKEAVNGSQLYATNQKVDAGWVATDGTNKIEVNPTDSGTTTLNFAGDNNITVTADTTNKAIQVALNDKVYLGGDHTEDSHNIVLDGDRGVIGLGSTIALDGRDGTAVIGGVNITTTAEEGTGKPVSTINGLSNTTWTGTTETPNRAATEGQLEDLSDTVNTGWYVADKNTAEDSTTGNFAVKPGETLTFNGDDNIDVEAKDHEVNVSLNDNITLGEGNSQININGNPENGEAALSIGDKFVVEQNGTTTIVADDGINNRPSQAQLTPDTTVTIAPSGVTFAGDDKGTTIIEGQKITSGGIVINGEDIYDKTTGIVTKGTITGLSNTTWDGKTDNASRVATEGQLKAVSDDVNAGWIATDSQNHEVNITPDNNKLNFAGDENVTVTAANNEIKVALNDDIVLGDYLNGGDGVLIGGSSGTISATNSITVGEDQGLIIDGQKEEIQGLSNTTWNEDVANAVERDSVAASTAATQGQLQEVSKVANAGWNASDGTNSISVKPNETLNFVGDENLTVSADGTDKKLKVSLNDNITLGEGPNQIQLNGAPGANDPALSVGTDKFVVDQDGSLSVSDKFNVDAETGNIYAANNSGSAIMMNDDSVALNAGGNGIAISDEGILLNTNGINEDIKLVTKGTSVSVDSNGTTFTNVNTNETTNIDGGTINVGDKLVVDQDGTTTIAVNDGTVMGNNTTMTVNKDGVAFSAYGNGTTVIDGQTISAGGVVINNNGSGTINGLTNTTWDDELAKQVANSEELQGTAATQGQLQQAVSEVAEVANAGWNAKAGGNTINVKPNETLNFEGDGNITVSATGGTSNELKFGLNDNITLGDKAGQKTSTSLTLYTDPTLKEVTRIGEDGNPETVKVTGYIPESYIDDQERVDNFISTHGGFMMYATNTSGEGVFGITTDGMVHAKDVISYMPNSDSTSKDKILKYSLNDIGDIVTQIAHGQYDKTGIEYTLISDFSSQADKDKPFQPEEGERTIGLAVREDGAVVVGAVVNEDGYINDSGIRINAEKRVNKDGTTSSDNMATITGLENTTWTPPEPEQSQIATFADDTPKTSRAATESQLNDLYSSVVGYNTYMTKDGSVNIDYGHVTLKGEKKYTVTTDANGVKSYSGGVILDNVAYASGEEGNEAVNVDYLNDAIKDAVKDGPVASNEKHLDTSKTYTPDKTTGKITINEVDGTGAVTGNQLVINDVASKAELDSLKTGVGDRNYNNVTDTTPIANGDSVTTAIGKLNNSIKGVTQDVINNSISGGHVDETGKVVLEKGEGENKSEVTTDIQLTDSEVSGVTLEKDTETGKNVLTITSTDKYDKNKTSSVTVSGLEIASTDDIKDVTGVASSEDLKDAYKDADKDGNATTEYITDSESMVEADVALDHAIQDVANTSYANDMVLSNRIDSVEKRLGNVEERIDKVGAMAAAIANLRTMGFDPEAPTEIAIGVGQYKSETGIAIGVFHYPNQDFMLSASLSSSGDELMGGIGATWKLGRKSAAERAKDEEARHLEQAEEMKKLAQQEKVKAQAQRHAKLLAERQQASQKNA